MRSNFGLSRAIFALKDNGRVKGHVVKKSMIVGCLSCISYSKVEVPLHFGLYFSTFVQPEDYGLIIVVIVRISRLFGLVQDVFNRFRRANEPFGLFDF